MKFTSAAQEIFDRYLLAIERKLPLQGRKDLKAEIESNLLDTIEDNLSDTAQEVIDEDVLEEQLKAIGSPRSVAHTFAPVQPLIATQHDYIFRIIVTIVVPVVVAVVFFVGLLSFAFSGGANPFGQILGTVDSMWEAAVSVIGISAIVFMILTRFFPDVNEKLSKEFLENEMKDWDLSDLPELVLEEDKVHVWEQVVGIVGGSFFLVILLFFFDRYVGLWFINEAGSWQMLPVLTDAVKALIPWWAVSAGMGLIQDTILLYQHRRSIFSRWFAILIKLVDIVILVMAVNIDKYLQFDRALALEKGMSLEGVTAFESMLGRPYFNYLLIFILVVTSITALVDIVKAIGYTAKAAE